jgi:hypothetical protein
VEITIQQRLNITEHESLITRKDGEKRYVKFSVHNISMRDQPTDYQIVEALDVTEHKRAVGDSDRRPYLAPLTV